MKQLITKLQGDKPLWVFVLVLAILSFMPVYSASTNLVYVAGFGSTTGILIKHLFLLTLGFVIMYGVHKVPYRFFSALSVVMLFVVVLLLIVTLAQGKTIGGANASRWLTIPFVGIGFQPSTLANVVLMTYVARVLARHKDKEFSFKESILKIWLPVGVILALIVPANLSTGGLLFLMVAFLCWLGGYPLKYLGAIGGGMVLIFALFILTAKAFPGLLPNRVDTWTSRLESFSDKDSQEGYQVENAKIAIATGGFTGRGPGKSVQKNFLPQSSSDFIFAIIVEEYGILFGATTVVLAYILLLYRFYVILKKAPSVFGALLVAGVGFPIIVQAMINMAVATNLMPVTGQNLPLISSGGTSIWMTCMAIGMVLSVSANHTIEASESTISVESQNSTDEDI